MNPDIRVGNRFPDLELPDHRNRVAKLSIYTAPTAWDQVLDFDDGYPLIVVFYRGFYCPRDGAQMRKLVRFQEELSVNYCKLVAISVDEPKVSAAFRYGLGASFSFLSDQTREAIDFLGIRDEVEGEYPGCSIPITFVLAPDLTIHKIYNGWFFVGRPTLEELRIDLRELMSRRKNYRYETYNRDELKAVDPPAEVWINGAPPLGESGNPVGKGVVQWFSLDDGYGVIKQESGKEIFLRFTGIPGEGYRTVRPGSGVEYEIAKSPTGVPCAINVRVTRAAEKWGPGSLTSWIVSGLNQ